MLALVARRVLISIPVLLLVSVLTFVLVSFVPGDAARVIAGPQATVARVEELREQLGLNQPLWAQYGNWLLNALHGDFGSSLFSGQQVASMLNDRMQVTLILVSLTTVISTAIGLTAGFVSALRGGALGKLLDAITYAGNAFPAFWIGVGLVLVFAIWWRILPPNGYTPLIESPVDWARGLVPPVTALAVGAVGGIAAFTRTATLDALRGDFVRVQFANGFSRRSIITKHLLRNAAPSVVTIVGLVFVSLLSAAVVIESVFALPGIGQAIVLATTQHDIPVIQAAVLYITVIVLLVNLVLDVAHGWLDPRVRAR